MRYQYYCAHCGGIRILFNPQTWIHRPRFMEILMLVLMLVDLHADFRFGVDIASKWSAFQFQIHRSRTCLFPDGSSRMFPPSCILPDNKNHCFGYRVGANCDCANLHRFRIGSSISRRMWLQETLERICLVSVCFSRK